MSNINDFPDDLLVKILSHIPTKDVVATSLLSKRWKFLWMYTTRLEYDQEYHYAKRTVFSRFEDKYLLSHQHPVLESLHFKFKTRYAYIEIGLWIRTAVSGLEYASLRLNVLNQFNILVYIIRLIQNNEEGESTSVSRLTYNAPYDPDKTTGFLGFVRKSLLSHQPHALETLYIDSFVIDIRPWIRTDVLCNLRELEVDADYSAGYIKLPSVLFTCQKLVVLKLRGMIEMKLPSTVCLPSLKTLHLLHLTLLNDESSCPLLSDLRVEHVVMPRLHIVMPSLQRLTIVTKSCSEHSPNLLYYYIRSLETSTPSLNYLNIQEFLSVFYVRVRIRSPWNFEPPSSVPTCLLSTLKILEWIGYNGTCADKDLVSYLLKHALCLKTAKIFTESCGLFEKEPKMDDLFSRPRGSTTCMLVLE
uniref:F-box domain-containing protein n=1 Tax=Brassica oleracea var. oleracea TaxID=109376 RepID=A0A0D2ZSY6_BRAOL